MKKKILVTGAGGQLGKTIHELYSNHDDFVFFWATKTDLNIFDKEKVKTLFDLNRFDFCINCAAYTNVEQAEKTPEPAYQINALAVKNLAEACYRNETVLIHISTDYVFDGEKADAYTVCDTPNPINEYGKSKLEGEFYIKEAMKKFFIVRTSWLYSKKYGNNFYKTILNKAETEKKLSIVDTEIGCPTDTVDLATFIIKIIKDNKDKYGVYHFCGAEVMTWYDFAKKILFENNRSHLIELVRVKNYRTFAQRPKNSVLSI